MPLQLFNSKTRKKELFTPLNPDSVVSLYTCGPTVYDYAHIGNLRTFLFEDVLRRTLEWEGYAVRQVMNITDVGHLTDDADSGEDKMEKGARREKRTVWDIAKQYTDAFIADTVALNILPPTERPRATDYIPQQIEMIAVLEKKGFTYTTSDGVYFDTSRFPAYGKMARLDVAGLEEGARVEKNAEKRNATDFALWKFSPTGEGVAQRAMEWESPWGVGFPGWHIECSAMAKALLGETIDIHCGGVDHMPVHHTNEIAQSEAANGVEFVHTWMHGEFLLINEGRMGKSEGNFITLSTLREKGFDPLAYRLFVLGAHYRSKLNFTWDTLKKSQTAVDKLIYTASQWDAPTEEHSHLIEKFETALEDDLNMPQAMAVVWELVKSDLSSGEKAATLYAFDLVLGLDIEKRAGSLRTKIATAGKELNDLLERRATARAAKDYATSDSIRNQIATMGFVVEDTPEGTMLRPVA